MKNDVSADDVVSGLCPPSQLATKGKQSSLRGRPAVEVEPAVLLC
jgi:hypothetical protein